MSTMHGWLEKPPPPIDWQQYQGFDLVTADSARLGVIESVVQDHRTGECCLLVTSPGGASRTLCVPSKFIGVITGSKLMLDVPFDQLHKLNLDQYNCS